MRAAIYDQYGGADVLEVREVEDPPVGPDTVLVRTSATSINPVDYKIREGYLQSAYPHHLPVIPGWDVSGVVEAVGPAVRTGVKVGDEVYGYVRRDDVAFGTTAELVPAPERTVGPKPVSLGVEESAALPLAGMTAYQGLVEELEVQADERVLIHAASGGVGHLAVQIAKALGATVVATGSPASHDWLRELGADEVLDYGAGPISEQLASVGGKVDAVLDLIGGEALADAPHQVVGGTRIVSVIDPDTVLALGGTYVFVRPDRDNLARLAELVDAGSLTVTVARTFALDDIVEAYRFAETGHPRGKVLVTTLSRSTTVGAIERNALPRWEIRSFSSGASSAEVRLPTCSRGTNSTSYPKPPLPRSSRITRPRMRPSERVSLPLG